MQPLLLTTIVWALPLGHWLTAQHVAWRQALGAFVVVVGLAVFALVGDPDAGVDNTSARNYVLAIVGALLLWLHKRMAPTLRAAVLGACAGLYFGLSATFTKPVVNDFT